MRKDMKVGLIFGIVILVASIIVIVMKNDKEPAPKPNQQANQNLEDLTSNPVENDNEALESEKPEVKIDNTSLFDGLKPIENGDTEVIDDMNTEDQTIDEIDTTDVAILDNSAVATDENTETETDDLTDLTENVFEVVDIPDEKPVLIPTEPDLPKDIYHVVASGDSLSAISQKYFGTVTFTKAIYEANKSVMVKGPDFINVGWKLRIPRPEEIEANK
ncbi:MAG: LysM peptidoglycan-binding domain-containing protein [Phycisphaerae bacterium]|nr:LysM peptidoglycan-binding domain-containing protein [Phycisphaerae bacterium]